MEFRPSFFSRSYSALVRLLFSGRSAFIALLCCQTCNLAAGFRRTKQPAELRFRALLTEGTPEVKLALA